MEDRSSEVRASAVSAVVLRRAVLKGYVSVERCNLYREAGADRLYVGSAAGSDSIRLSALFAA